MALQFGLLVLGSYLLGSVPMAYLAAKRTRGIDLRHHGSGNVGTTNLLSLSSWRLAVPVFAFDVFKGMITVWVAWRLGLSSTEQAVVGIAAVSGHNWPIFLRFSGGRGVATTLGASFMIPLLNSLVPGGVFVIIIVVLVGIVLVSKCVFDRGAVGVLAAATCLPIVSWVFQAPLGLSLGLMGMLLILVIRRLTAAQPVKVTIMRRRQILLNRLLFDRDIKDKRDWMSLVLKGEEVDDEVIRVPLPRS